jgi:hypothetical protein
MRHDMAGSNGCERYVFHQSDLEQYQLCPERARQLWVDGVIDSDHDASATGSAAHAGIEHVLQGGSMADAFSIALEVFAAISKGPNFEWKKLKPGPTAMTTIAKHIRTALQSWYTQIYPQVGPARAVEYYFEHCVDERWMLDGDGHWREVELWFAGTIDLIDDIHPWDWKVPGDMRKYQSGKGGEGWKLRRWGIQPTMYTFAAFREGLLTEQPITFNFAGLSKTKPDVAVILPCERDQRHWQWLTELAWSAVGHLRADLERWPMTDNHALCSDLWCPAWDTCPRSIAPLP